MNKTAIHKRLGWPQTIMASLDLKNIWRIEDFNRVNIRTSLSVGLNKIKQIF